jgi:hypothetical protein
MDDISKFPETPAEAAERSKAESMKEVDDNADEAWKEFMRDIIWEVACTMADVTTDPVCICYRSKPDPKPNTHNWKALGPRMQDAAKLGYIEITDRFVKSTDGTRRHGAPLQVWKSLVFGKKHPLE